MNPGPAHHDLVSDQITAARRVLTLLNFDSECSNERSALVLLALLGITPHSTWQEATNNTLRTVQIIEWMSDHYNRS